MSDDFNVALSLSPSKRIMSSLAFLHPASFALIMATGIVSIGCHLHNLKDFIWPFWWINISSYLFMWICLALKFFYYPENIINDISNHSKSTGFFTIVASTSVLAAQFVLMEQSIFLAKILWWLALICWVILTYSVFTIITVIKIKPKFESSINGGWLLVVVATQSIVVTGAILDGNLNIDQDILHFMLMGFWSGGGILYLWIIALIFYRYMFFKMDPQDLMPPYWINMGAVAISTLAGTQLVLISEKSAILLILKPFIIGMTTAYWATATWWIPMLLTLGLWRHIKCKVKMKYSTLYWGLVFPLGMYSVCTYKLAHVLNASFLKPISQIFIVAALCAWLLTFLGWSKEALIIIFVMIRKPNLNIVEKKYE